VTHRKRKRQHYDRRRGRHKKRASRETEVWNTEHLIPARPPWMDEATYLKLAEIRKGEHGS
jgi:hypothetical protein